MTGTTTVSSMADVVIATLPIAPSSSPQASEAFAPIICAEVPIAKPFADLLLIPKVVNNLGPIHTENNADITTKRIVIELTPPRLSEIVNAIGRVTDRGIKEASS